MFVHIYAGRVKNSLILAIAPAIERPQQEGSAATPLDEARAVVTPGAVLSAIRPSEVPPQRTRLIACGARLWPAMQWAVHLHLTCFPGSLCATTAPWHPHHAQNLDS